MTTLRINIEANNAAFLEPDCGHGQELARILRGIADDLDAHGDITRETLRDINGNAVGSACIVDEFYWDAWPSILQRQAD